MQDKPLNRLDVIAMVRHHFSAPNADFSITTDEESPDPFCVYRSPEGNRCAFGVVIPDEEYDSGMEKNVASAVWNKFPNIRHFFANDVTPGFLDALQRCHDDNSPAMNIDGKARGIDGLLADLARLEYKVLEGQNYDY